MATKWNKKQLTSRKSASNKQIEYPLYMYHNLVIPNAMKNRKVSLFVLFMFAVTIHAFSQGKADSYVGDSSFHMKPDTFKNITTNYNTNNNYYNDNYHDYDYCNHCYNYHMDCYNITCLDNTTNYNELHNYDGNIWDDTLLYNTVKYTLPQFYRAAATGKIKLNDGDEYKDSVWFRHKWIDKNKYLQNYCFEKPFVPGLEYQYYKPKISDSVGTYSGIAVEYVLYSKFRSNKDYGPCQLRFYSKLGYLTSSKSNEPSMLNTSLGLTMSFERNPQRTFLVPYFGMESGGFFMSNHNIFYYMPTAGIQLLATHNIFIGVNGGYVYTNTHFTDWQGMFAQANVDISFW